MRSQHPEGRWSPFSVALAATALVISLTLIALVGYCTVRRVTFPFGLSRMEGYFVEHAHRVAQGDSLYGPPDEHFVPLIYTPLSYFLAAPLIRLGVGGFFAARLVSIGGVVGALLVGVWIVRRNTRRAELSLLVPLLTAASYFDVGAHYDQMRPDNVLACFYLLSVASMMVRRSAVAIGVGVLAMVGAVFTKQSAVVVLALFLGSTLFVRPRVAALTGLFGTAAVVAIGGVAQVRTDGWFLWYTVSEPAHHEFAHRAMINALSEDLLGSFGLVTTAAVLAAIAIRRFRTSDSSHRFALDRGITDQAELDFRIVLLATLAATAFALIGRWNQGAIRNIYAVNGLVHAVFVPSLIGWLDLRFSSSAGRGLVRRMGAAAVVVLLIHGLHDPKPYLPGWRDRLKWEEFHRRTAEYGPPDRVWVPSFGAALDGHGSIAPRPGTEALKDYVGGHYGRRTGRALPESLRRLIDERYFNVIMVRQGDEFIEPLIECCYRRDAASEPIILPQFSGFPAIPEVAWVPRKPDPPDER